jgi:hypothetical protein
MMAEPAYLESSAIFDDERIYRYNLLRRWASGPTCLWLMLNPSTADETKLDPTLRRCLAFTRAWNPGIRQLIVGGEPKCFGFMSMHDHFGAFEVCNLYALRSTDPEGLWKVPDPVGPNNDVAIQTAAKRAHLVIVGWGDNAKPARERQIAQLLADVGVQPYALKLCKSGSPNHPLYLPETAKPFPWHAKGLR